MYELALFAGAGGGILGGVLLGHRCAGAVEIEPYARNVLAARQQDGSLPAFPIWDDVRTFTKRNNACRRYFRFLRKIRHSLVISGGFPCQDISTAGKGAGIDGERSGLWAEFARIIREVRPAYAFVENSPALTSRGLGRVLGDLSEMGYNARWCVLGADDAGAPHVRKRIWILADAVGEQNNGIRRIGECGRLAVGRDKQAAFGQNGEAGADRARGQSSPLADADSFREQQPEGNFGKSRRQTCDGGQELADAEDARHQLSPAVGDAPEIAETFGDGADAADTDVQRCEVQRQHFATTPRQPEFERGDWWSTEPAVCRVADGLADQLDIHGVVTSAFLGRVASGVPMRTKRIAALGNGQVPATAALAWRILTNLEM